MDGPQEASWLEAWTTSALPFSMWRSSSSPPNHISQAEPSHLTKKTLTLLYLQTPAFDIGIQYKLEHIVYNLYDLEKWEKLECLSIKGPTHEYGSEEKI